MSKDWKAKKYNVLGAIKPKDLIGIVKIGYDHLCPRKENLVDI
jgi:hypothetical protein